MTAVFVALVVVAALAWANGANDVSKGIATLVGSGVTGYSRATFWGTVWTALGAAVSILVSGAMLATFGSGLLASGVAPTWSAVLGAIGGAAGWVLVATRAGLPVSTTHAIVGAVAGAAVAAYGVGGVAWDALVSRVALPLAVTPLLALALGVIVSRVFRLSAASGGPAADCVCLTGAAMPLVGPAAFVGRAHVAAATAFVPMLQATTGRAADCAASQPTALRLTVDHLHWLSSGAVSFSRGLNDAPKIAALAVSALALAPSGAVSTPIVFGLVGLAMVAGSQAGGRRVTRLLAEKVTPMSHHEGLVANGVTAALVTTGAVFGLPMSTTHVSSGAIVGIGTARQSVLWSTVRVMALAWAVTLPAAAVLGAVFQIALAAVVR